MAGGSGSVGVARRPSVRGLFNVAGPEEFLRCRLGGIKRRFNFDEWRNFCGEYEDTKPRKNEMKNERMMNESLYFDRGLRDLYRIDDYMTLEDYSAMMHHCIE